MKCSRKRLWFLTTLLLLTTACGAKKQSASVEAAPAKPVEVTTIRSVVRQVPASFDETGTFVAAESSDIAPLVAGRVIRTPVDAGAFVKEGQVICEMDHRDAELKLQQVRAQLAEASAAVRQAQLRIGLGAGKFDETKVPEVAAARANFESAQAQARLSAADAQRYSNLVASGDVSRSAFEKARTQQETADAQVNASRQQYEGALNAARQSYQIVSSSEASLDSVRAQVSQAEKGLADTYIRAPFDGYITDRPVSAGEYAALTNKLATIVSVKTLKLQLQTPEQRAAKVRVGMTVVAHVSAYPDREFEGKVSAVNPAVDPNSRVFVLEARFQNPDNALRPGMFSTARVVLPGGEDGVFVPRKAVIRDKTTDSNYVYVVDRGQARMRVVLIGETDGDAIRVQSGLAANESVVTTNQSQLFDGATVLTTQSALPRKTGTDWFLPPQHSSTVQSRTAKTESVPAFHRPKPSVRPS
jgi:multidrug efflux pump subunit AcrA (membrane-fusion protein)